MGTYFIFFAFPSWILFSGRMRWFIADLWVYSPSSIIPPWFEGLHSRLNLARSRPWTKMAQWSHMFPNSRGTRAAFGHLKLYRIRCEIAFFRQASRSSTGRWTSLKWPKAGDRALDVLSMNLQTEFDSLAYWGATPNSCHAISTPKCWNRNDFNKFDTLQLRFAGNISFRHPYQGAVIRHP